MIPSLLGGNDAPPGVRRPIVEIRFGGGGGAAGGLGGLAAAAAGALGVGGGDDPWRRSLIALSVEAGLAPAADVAEIWLSPDAQPVVAVGDEGSIALGYEDAEAVPVFTGAVAGVRRAAGGATRITVANNGLTLARLRVNQSYEQQTAGDIARDLAERAGVDAGTIEDGVDLAFFVADDRCGAWEHLAALARRSGYLAAIGPDNKLAFAPPGSGEPVRTFTYGVDVVALEAADTSPVLGAVTAVGEGAAGTQGQDAAFWLIKDPASVTAAAGAGTPERRFSDPALRTSDAAQTAARGRANAAALNNVSGRLLGPGAPEVIVGSVIAVAGAPEKALNGQFLVRAVRHFFDKREGFTTRIAFNKTGGAGGGGLPGALGGLL